MTSLFDSPGLVALALFLLLQLPSDWAIDINSECGHVREISNGIVADIDIKVDFNSRGRLIRRETVTYACNNGFNFYGRNNKSTCLRRSWSRLPRCVAATTTRTTRTQRTHRRTPIPKTTSLPRGTTALSPSGFTRPRRGSQCNFGYSSPHTLCQNDSPNLVQLEPVNINEVLDRHNHWRDNVSPPAENMPKLQWDEDLAIEAERWASTCPRNHDNAYQRKLPARSGKEAWDYVGQNLFWRSANSTLADAIESWAEERHDWEYGIVDPANTVGHYTQMIWAKTLYVGCGKTYCRNARFAYTIVCNYGPGGNVATERQNGKWLYYAHPYGKMEDSTVDCPRWTTLNAHVSGRGRAPGSMRQITCNRGFELVGNRIVRCLEDGSWSQGGFCREIQSKPPAPAPAPPRPSSPADSIKRCPRLDRTVPSGKLSGRGRQPGSTRQIVCNTGFQLTGERIIRCLNNGSWSKGGDCSRTTTTSPTSDFTEPRRGPQCKYGKSYPHALCYYDSQNLVQLEPVNIGEALDRHNHWRDNVSPPAKDMPELQWDEDLAIEAERWASTCTDDHDDDKNRVLPARGNKEEWGHVGQNLFWHSANRTLTDAIDAWASERHDWQYGITSPTAVVGHYTQIIWAKTLYVGCAKSYCRNTQMAYAIACNYGPGGNMATIENGFNYYGFPYERV